MFTRMKIDWIKFKMHLFWYVRKMKTAWIKFKMYLAWRMRKKESDIFS